MNVTNWVADKLAQNKDIEILERVAENFLLVRVSGNYQVLVAVLGIKKVITLLEVEPLFAGETKPQLVINIPSSTLWSGAAIDRIHSESAAFGTLGDVSKAALTENAGSYRDNKMAFFINAMTQHSNVSSVSYIYDGVFRVNRKIGTDLVVAIIEAYNMSAEDVRNAKSRFGDFDIVVKSSSYGSITSQAEVAAKSMGAQALTFGQLMGRLAN